MKNKIYNVLLYNTGNFEIEESFDEKMLGNDILYFGNKKGTGIEKQAFQENINNVKLYLLKIQKKKLKTEIKELQKTLKSYNEAESEILKS